MSSPPFHSELLLAKVDLVEGQQCDASQFLLKRLSLVGSHVEEVADFLQHQDDRSDLILSGMLDKICQQMVR